MADSITEWANNLGSGEKTVSDDAARQLWLRFRQRIAAFARQVSPAAAANDADDIANRVLKSLWRVASEQSLAFADRDELWALIATLTHRKVVDRIRRETAQKRNPSGGRIVSLELADELENVVTPEFVALLKDEVRQVFEFLKAKNPSLHEVARMILDGYDRVEIARELDVVPSTITRKWESVRAMIRDEYGNQHA